MKLWLRAAALAAALIAAAFICVGFYKMNDVETTYTVHVVKSGETLNGIAAKYYHRNTKWYISQEDYAMMVRIENNKLYNMDRELQIGDRVQVPVYTVREWKF